MATAQVSKAFVFLLAVCLFAPSVAGAHEANQWVAGLIEPAILASASFIYMHTFGGYYTSFIEGVMASMVFLPPGFGHLYAGSTGGFIASVGLWGLGWACLIESFSSYNYILGFVALPLFISAYAFDIFHAPAAARKHNAKHSKEAEKEDLDEDRKGPVSGRTPKRAKRAPRNPRLKNPLLAALVTPLWYLASYTIYNMTSLRPVYGSEKFAEAAAVTIPGFGHIYAGEPSGFLISFTAWIAGLYLVQNGMEGVGIPLLTGAILYDTFPAAMAAVRYNGKYVPESAQNASPAIIPMLAISPKGDFVGLAVRMGF